MPCLPRFLALVKNVSDRGSTRRNRVSSGIATLSKKLFELWPYGAGCRNRWLRESAGAETLTNCGLAETAGLTVDPAAPCLDSVLKHSSPLPEPRSFSSWHRQFRHSATDGIRACRLPHPWRVSREPQAGVRENVRRGSMIRGCFDFRRVRLCLPRIICNRTFVILQRAHRSESPPDWPCEPCRPGQAYCNSGYHHHGAIRRLFLFVPRDV